MEEYIHIFLARVIIMTVVLDITRSSVLYQACKYFSLIKPFTLGGSDAPKIGSV